ncbi:helix-turn-helix transcriptional regulator [Priestia megaterium]|uniref:helix-turn-helix domain-containing protein n=1 Tax=Priestia megaterium TaxID=1404 RepID=UPI002E1D9417|nr:helix-turn-helix transcriptional regulator [Priestia megaterium]
MKDIKNKNEELEQNEIKQDPENKELEKDGEKEVGILGQRMELIRKSLGYSYQELADIVGKSKPTMVGYEKGYKFPKFKEVDKLAEILGTTTSYLTGETDNPAPPLTQKEAISLAHAIEKAPKDIWHYDGVPLTDEDIKRILDKLNSAMKYNKSDNRA